VTSGVSLPSAHFEAIYASDPDPWRFRTSDYEQQKYAATVAALLCPRYRHGFEVACSPYALVRAHRAGEGAASGHRCDAARLAGMPLRIAGPLSNTTYWEEMILPRLRGQRGGVHPALGGALWAGGGRSLGLRHAGSRLRPWRPAPFAE
jgi:hypothetical protein